MILISYCHRTKTKAWHNNNVLMKGLVLYMQKVDDDNVLSPNGWLLLVNYLYLLCKYNGSLSHLQPYSKTLRSS